GFSAEVVRATLGYVFALSEGEVYEIDPVTLATTPQRVPEGFGPVGALTSDGTGRFVALDGGKNIAIYDVTIGRWAVHLWSGSDDAFPNDPDLIDGTRDVPAWGMAVQAVELDRDPVALDWYQETPGQSRVEVHVTFAESAEAMPA